MAVDNLVLVHAPSVYDFRDRPTLWGPISDLVPSTTVFDMYPIGFSTIAEYLERKGFRVRIVNLAVRMLKDASFNAEKYFEEINPSAFGIDLHWLPHAHGAVEVAKVIKKIHPGTPVIMGGLSASYFHKELIHNPHVDFILRGDSTEEPLSRLLEWIVSGAGRHELESIPNLTWKGNNGAAHVNPLSYVPPDLNDISSDHSFAVHAVARDKNLVDYLPFLKWTRYPITAALTCKGCTQNCTICGGSRFSYGKFYGRKRIAFRDPEFVAHDIRRIARYSRGPVFVLGDIRQAGSEYAKKFLRAIQGIDAQVIFEFFWGVEKEFIEEIAGAVRRFVVQISPESHDPRVLKLANKSFTAETIESSINNVLSSGCQRLDVFFMSGMPGQTYTSVMESIAYCGRMLNSVEGDPRLRFFISPLAPFLDPGSLAYERSDLFGYRKLCHTLSEHRDALLSPSWKYVLSYETNWMKRSEIVDSTYQAAFQLNRYKEKYGQIGRDKSQLIEDRILKAVALMKQIDCLVNRNDERRLLLELQRLRPEIEEVNSSTMCEKEELDLPVNARVPIKTLNAASMLIGDKVKKLWKKAVTKGRTAFFS